MNSDQRGLMATYAAAIAKRYRVHHHELIAEAMQARTFVAKVRMLYRADQELRRRERQGI